MPTQPNGSGGLDFSAPLETLVDTLPRVADIVGKLVVVKIGGSIKGEGTLLQDLAILHRIDMEPVVVHGGGPAITELSQRLGLETRFVQGRRYTDEATLECARMVLAGRVNGDIVVELNRLGTQAFGLSGLDGQAIKARLRDRDLGLVGDVDEFNIPLIKMLSETGYIPVLSPIASGPDATPLNVNADSVAGELAYHLYADRLVMFTDVPGVLDREGKQVRILTRERAVGMIQDGTIKGGMIPKIEACLRALERVPRVHVLDGRRPHALIEGLLTNAGTGTTMIAS